MALTVPTAKGQRVIRGLAGIDREMFYMWFGDTKQKQQQVMQLLVYTHSWVWNQGSTHICNMTSVPVVLNVQYQMT